MAKKKELKNKKTGRNKYLVYPSPPSTQLSEDKKVQLLAESLSDPTDYRTDDELSTDLSIPIRQIRQLRNTPEFIEPVRQAFRRRLTSVEIDIVKHILTQSKGGSLAASRTVLELTGSLVKGGNTVNIISSASSEGSSAWASSLSDEDLDREVHRLLMDTVPEDVIYDSGKVVPATYVVTEEETEDDLEPSRNGRSNNQNEKGEDSNTSA